GRRYVCRRARTWLACAFRRFALLMILSENRTPLFGIMRVPGANLFFEMASWWAKLGRGSVSRERSSASSLPGLTRQSMRGTRLLELTALFDSLGVSMDHRVKPGGDDGKRKRDELLRPPRSENGAVDGDHANHGGGEHADLAVQSRY